MKYFLAGCALVVSIMGTATIFVNAEGSDFTEAKPSKRNKELNGLKDLIATLSKNGRKDQLAATVGPHLSLKDLQPITYIALQPNHPRWKQNVCDLVFERNEKSGEETPHCLVLMEINENGKDVTSTHYRFDLKGKLVSAYIMNGRKDDSGRPIKGSAQYFPQDTSDKEIIASAQKELKFWLSGEYKKYVAPAKPMTTAEVATPTSTTQ
jgi:hypothetical protein